MNLILLKSENSSSEIDSYEKAILESGSTVKLIPALEFAFIDNGLDKVDLKSYGGLILTSPRAAEAVLRSKLQCSSCKACFVVGEKTASVAKAAGFDPIGESCGNGKSLGEYIVQSAPFGRPLLFLAGKKHSKDMLEILQRSDIDVEVRVVYESIVSPHLVSTLGKALDDLEPKQRNMLFFSPLIFTACKDVLEGRDVGHLFAIGPSTANCMTEQGFTPSGVAESPNENGVLSMLKAVINNG